MCVNDDEITLSAEVFKMNDTDSLNSVLEILLYTNVLFKVLITKIYLPVTGSREVDKPISTVTVKGKK